MAVEARKLFDTRSGQVMAVILIVLTLALIAGRGLTPVRGSHA